jgi:hypothetical protein
MPTTLSNLQMQALRKDTSLFEASGTTHLDGILSDIQTQLNALPIAGTVAIAAVAADLAAKLPAVSWGTPAAEAAGAIEITLQVTDLQGNNLAAQKVLDVHVADTLYGNDSAAATVVEAVAPVGTILSGSGTAAVKVQTDATGKVRLSVHAAGAVTRYLLARAGYGSPVLNCEATATLTFTG